MGTVAVLKKLTGEELAVFNNSSRFRSSTAVARIVRAGPVFAGTSAIAGEGVLVTADADMVGGVGGGGGWTEASDRAGAITVAVAAAAAADDGGDDAANRERVTGHGSCSESRLRSSSNKRRALDSAIDGRPRTSCSHGDGGSSKDISNKRMAEEKHSRAQIEEGADRSIRTSLEDIVL